MFSPTPARVVRLRSTTSKLVNDGITAIKNVYQRLTNAKVEEDVEKVEKESVQTVINCLVKLMTGMFRTLSDHSKQIKDVVEQFASDKKSREALLSKIQRKWKRWTERIL